MMSMAAIVGSDGERDARVLSKQEIIELRKEFISPSLSIHYAAIHPLHIVYGKGSYLYNESDQGYLDCINNVAQVGHCHPRVVAATQAQVKTLDSSPFHANSHYMKHLLTHFTPPLDHVLFTNSGSEANDLALRLCEHVSGGTEVLVLDGAYHGHTQPLMGLSSYKAKQQRYQAIQLNSRAWICSLPDCYRGKFRGEGAVDLYVQDVADILDQIKAQGKKVSCFLVESSPGCAGQLQLPLGYLAAVFKLVRGAGGLCVVDEIQTGFGRAGDSFWMYECQDIVPDIVTIGKPMGNGHPISGVVTSSDISRSYLKFEAETFKFAHDQYHSDPVSLAIAEAVLSVIEEEKLQENARNVGGYIKSKLALLKSKYSVIGDIRGRGLFLGVEIVKGSEGRLLPDADLCTSLIHRMLLEHCVLIKEDGLDNNVLKIKPPLVFSMNNADTLVHALEECLAHLTAHS